MGSVELWILRVKRIADDEPLGNNEAQKSKRQKPSAKAKSKRQQSTQGTKSLDLEVGILADQNQSNRAWVFRRTISTASRYSCSLEELKNLLMKVKEESEKVDLKLNLQKTKIIASGAITSWQIDGETVTDFILGGSKITADGDCRKVMTNLDSILQRRQRHPTPVLLPGKSHGRGSLVGCHLWGHTESDTTDVT